MPRGSRPGERRGGRQRGTPNKKTVLKDALFCAAASSPDTSPLQFMLVLMRDPTTPTDLRIEMAAAAAPFGHPRPHARSRACPNALDTNPAKSAPHLATAAVEDELRGFGEPLEQAPDPVLARDGAEKGVVRSFKTTPWAGVPLSRPSRRGLRRLLGGRSLRA